jgi:hypothetical protein
VDAAHRVVAIGAEVEMTAAVIALSAALAGALSLIAWLVYGHVGAADQIAQERAAHSATTLDRDRIRFDNEAKDKEIAKLNRTIDALSKEPDAKPNADLRADDIDARSVRAAIKAKAAEARRTSPVYADVSRLHSEATADAAGPAEVQPAGPLDPNELLR